MIRGIMRNHRDEELSIPSRTILSVKVKKKTKEPKMCKSKTEVKPIHRVKTNPTAPQGPTDELSRRRLSDSLELTLNIPPRVRRRSVSFDPLTVFKTAILENDVDTTKNVLNSGKVNANTNLDGVPPVLLAAKDGCAECLELLIKNGGQIDVVDKYGLSPLELAVREGHFDCAQILISSGANVISIRDGYYDESIGNANRSTTRSRSRTF